MFELVSPDTATTSTRSKLIHLHIAKTAGTSIRRLFVDEFGASGVMYYDHLLNKAIRSSHRVTASERPALDQVKQVVHRRRLHSYVRPLFIGVKKLEGFAAVDPAKLAAMDSFDAFTGHFNARDVERWGLADQTVVSVIREPLQRTWSNYNQWQRTHAIGGGKEWEERFSRGQSFEDFALDPSMQNFQTRQLGNLPLRALGIQEALPEFLEEIGLNVPVNLPHLNVHTGAAMPNLSPSFMNEFATLNTEDYALYAATRERYFAQS